MVERRFKGEANQGVKTVTGLQGDAVWKAADDGLWSWDLLENAIGRSPSRNAGDIRDNCRRFQRPSTWGNFVPGPIAFHIEYLDGLKATVLQLDGHVADETFAAKVGGEKKPVSTLFYLPPPPGAAFLQALASHIETFLITGKPPYPVERTQLTGGILTHALESRVNGAKPLAMPDLAIRYAVPADSGFTCAASIGSPFRRSELAIHSRGGCHVAPVIIAANWPRIVPWNSSRLWQEASSREHRNRTRHRFCTPDRRSGVRALRPLGRKGDSR